MGLSDIYEPIQGDLEKVEQSIAEASETGLFRLTELLKYALHSGGKRIRPALTLFCGKFHLYDVSLLVPMATSTELLHTATLVHDDIIDHSPVRRGRPTVSRNWDDNSALLLGDYLFAKAGSLAASTGNMRVVKLFAQTLMTISGGEVRQTVFTFDVKSAREYYYSWISAKTASLFSMSSESGAILSQASEDVIQALKDYGQYCGMAFQIVDDILDFIGSEDEVGKPVGSDLSEGAVTLPTILYVESHPDDVLVTEAIQDRDAQTVALAMDRIRNSQILEECMEIAADFSARACTALDILPNNDSRKCLVDLAQYIVRRRR